MEEQLWFVALSGGCVRSHERLLPPAAAAAALLVSVVRSFVRSLA